MLNKLNHQPRASYNQGGFRIFIDGYRGWVPGYDDPYDINMILDVIVITTLMFICCFSLTCLFSSNVNMAARGAVTVVESGDQARRLPGRYRHGLRLLNRDEVECLPQVEFGLERVLEGGGMHPYQSQNQDHCDHNKCRSSDSDDNGDCKCDREGKDHVGLDGNETEYSSSTPLLPVYNQNNDTGHGQARGNSSAFANELFEDISCTICLEDYEDGEILRVLPCNHCFHDECIIPWLTDRAPTCPLCKAIMEVEREGDSDVEESDDDSDDESVRATTADGTDNDDSDGAERSTGSSRNSFWSRMFPTGLFTNFSTPLDHLLDDSDVLANDGISLNNLREPLLEEVEGSQGIHSPEGDEGSQGIHSDIVTSANENALEVEVGGDLGNEDEFNGNVGGIDDDGDSDALDNV